MVTAITIALVILPCCKEREVKRYFQVLSSSCLPVSFSGASFPQGLCLESQGFTVTDLSSSFKRGDKRLQGRCLQTFWERPDNKFLGFVGLTVLTTAILSLLCKSGHGQISREI